MVQPWAGTAGSGAAGSASLSTSKGGMVLIAEGNARLRAWCRVPGMTQADHARQIASQRAGFQVDVETTFP